MATKTQVKASIVRAFHQKNGGILSTSELAQALSVTQHTIRNYLRNETSVNTAYSPPQQNKITKEAVRFLIDKGLDQATIATLYGCTVKTVRNLT